MLRKQYYKSGNTVLQDDAGLFPSLRCVMRVAEVGTSSLVHKESLETEGSTSAAIGVCVMNFCASNFQSPDALTTIFGALYGP
jgi:hypothetical protein